MTDVSNHATSRRPTENEQQISTVVHAHYKTMNDIATDFVVRQDAIRQRTKQMLSDLGVPSERITELLNLQLHE